MVPLIAGLGTTELLIILAVLVLLFGASKLPELARGSGRALRIFKAETKGLLDDDDKPTDDSRAAEAKLLDEGTKRESQIHEAEVVEPEQRPGAHD